MRVCVPKIVGRWCQKKKLNDAKYTQKERKKLAHHQCRSPHHAMPVTSFGQTVRSWYHARVAILVDHANDGAAGHILLPLRIYVGPVQLTAEFCFPKAWFHFASSKEDEACAMTYTLRRDDTSLVLSLLPSAKKKLS